MNNLIVEVNEFLKDRNFEYAFCGGWAVDLFLGGESRPHGDIDILAYWKDRNSIIEYLWENDYIVYEMLGFGEVHHIIDVNKQFLIKRNIFGIKKECDFVNFTKTNRPNIYCVEFMSNLKANINFIEFLFNDKNDTEFLYARNKQITRPIEKSILYNNDIPYLSPELCLLYKSTDTQRKGYQNDFELLLKKMSIEQKVWLNNALAILYPNGHEWMVL